MKKQENVTFSSPIRYRSNIFFLILSLILWTPLGMVLLLENAYFIQGRSRFSLKYHSSWGWLYFWSLLFFPIVFVLLVLKGVDIVQKAGLR